MTSQDSYIIQPTNHLPKPTVKLSVACLGPSSVGKTCTLTVMHRFFRDEIVKTDFKVQIDEESFEIMRQHEQELEDLVAHFDASFRGPVSTESCKNIKFILVRDKWRSRDALGIDFYDVPGEWLNQNTSSTSYQEYFKQVKDSGAVIIPIDTLALMQEDGKFHKQLNEPESVTQMISTAYETLTEKEKRLVLFVPVKCETYVRAKNMEDLIKAVQKGYEELIHDVLSPKANNVAAVITPVQTVGCVVCGGADVDIDTGEWKGWNLNKTRVDAPMQTQWEDQPLRYLLRFLLHQYINNNQAGVFGAINNLLGANNDLKDALNRFAKGIVKTPPFYIIQGSDALKID